MRIPLRLTFIITKATQALIERLGKGGGTALPGLMATKLNIKLFPLLASQLQGTIVVVGTNGKTTTSRLAASFLEGAGHKVIHNRTGSNLIRGLVSTLIRHADWHMKLKGEWAVFEVDEAVLPEVIKVIKPNYILVLNLFRDQLDRYGEVNSLAGKWRQACQLLPPTSTLILNADDPLVNSLSLDTQAKVVGFSLINGKKSSAVSPRMARHADSRRCPICGANLTFTAINYSHLGQYSCPNQDYQMIKADYIANQIALNGLTGSSFKIQLADQQSIDHQLHLAGLYNIYNALAANALGLSLGLDKAMLQQRTKNFEAVFGRLEQIQLGSTVLTMVLVKNPTGYNQVLQTLVGDATAKNFWLILNDYVADGRDISWIWDVEFEQLRDSASQLIVSGSRRYDLELRLKYADFSEQVITTKNLVEGLRLIATTKPTHIYCLCTYTAMLELRKLLQKNRLVTSYHHQEASS